MIDLETLFPRAMSRPLGASCIDNASTEGLDKEFLTLEGKTSRYIKLLKPGERLESLYEKINGKGKKAYFAFSRTHPDRPARTIAKDSAGLFHYKEDRTLTVGEYKRIASFPDEFRFIGSFNSALQRLGNSVPPLLMRALALQIKSVLFNGEPLKPYPKGTKYLEILESAWHDHLKPREPNAPTVISTFAGGGGSSLGYSMAGYRELLAVEWDNNAVATFKLNFPDVPVYHGDIAKLSVEECLRMVGLKPGELDVLDGSPPCQGFSTAGKRVMDDPRNQLFREYVRLLRGLKPKVFVMENVSGMVKGKMKLIFAEILRELKASGYRVSARLLNAMYFNVPQSRQRMIFIGVREDLGIEPSHPKAESKPVTVREAISDLGNIQDKEICHVWIDETTNGKNTVTFKIAEKAKQGEKYAGHQRRAIYDSPFPTITKPSSDGMNINQYLRNSHCHPIYTRTFSVRELARGQSFPDEFLFTGLEGANRIGNSVPPLLMRSIANHIRQQILINKEPQLIK